MHCKLLSSFKNRFKTHFLFNNKVSIIKSDQFVQNQNNSSMAMQPNLTKSPGSVRGMTILDRTKFNKYIIIPVLNLKNVKISDAMPYLKNYIFKIPGLKVLQCLDKQTMSVLLNPDVLKNWSDFDTADRVALENLSLTAENLKKINLAITYDNYHAHDIFKAVLPTEQESFSSFSKIGHIIHVNLREHLLPFKNLIGQVLLDKIPNTRTVVNKTTEIDNTYRNFKMELLCGAENMLVKVKENCCEFEFDFSKVYWNPRLSTEHERIVKMLNPGDVLFDVFAGVGPFSIPAARLKCTVFANDLNPDSYKWLNRNLEINKIDINNLKTFNKDGRDFIVEVIRANLMKYINKHNIHIVMNLPALAVEFLSAFCKLYKAGEINIIKLPIIHVYCFAKGENYVEIAKELVSKNIKCDVNDKIVDVFKVRTVSSMKEMVRVSFKLDEHILIDSDVTKRKHDDCSADAVVSKKCCHGEKQDEHDKNCEEEHKA